MPTRPLLPPVTRVPLEHDRPDDLREGERQHRQVDAREADAEPAEDERAERGEQRREHERRLHRQPERLEAERRAVGAEAEVGGVAERMHSRRAHQEVQAGGEQDGDQDVDHQHDRVRRRAGEEARRARAPAARRRRPGARRAAAAERRLDARPRRAPRACGLPNRPRRSPDEHHRHHQELGDERQLAERERRAEDVDRAGGDAERLDHRDQHRGDEGAADRAHAADDDHHEDLADQRQVEVEVGRLVRHLQGAAERGEEGAEREHRREEPALVDAERADHLAVLRRGAHEQAPAGSLQQQPERAEDDRADEDREHVVARERLAEDVDRALQRRRLRAEQVFRAPGAQRRVADDEDEREGREQLVQLGRRVEPAQDQDLDQRAERGDGERRDQHAAPEAERAGAPRVASARPRRRARACRTSRARS